jgi:hypothetical protein
MNQKEINALVQRIAELHVENEALKIALKKISEMGVGYATEMVVTADRALGAQRGEGGEMKIYTVEQK